METRPRRATSTSDFRRFSGTGSKQFIEWKNLIRKSKFLNLFQKNLYSTEQVPTNIVARTPSFRYMGGKARLRKWLISHFPKEGIKYIEPFAGLGNVFYLSKKELSFNEWHLGDINSFLSSMLAADLNELPDTVSKYDFQFWKESDSPIAKIIEPKITFAGKGYKAGFDGGHPSHPPYNGKLHRIICDEAKRLLQGVKIKQICWTEWNYLDLDVDDFVYFDPPYFNTKAVYPNIDHTRLVETLNSMKCRWALSGYDNHVYQKELHFKCRYEKTRNSEIKSSNTRKYEAVSEVLWTNF